MANRVRRSIRRRAIKRRHEKQRREADNPPPTISDAEKLLRARQAREIAELRDRERRQQQENIIERRARLRAERRLVRERDQQQAQEDRERAAAEAGGLPPDLGTRIRVDEERARRRRRLLADSTDFYTMFKAAASSGPSDDPKDPFGIYAFTDRPPPGYISGPGAFYSNAGPDYGGFGQVRFEGKRSITELIDEQNQILGVFDERGNGPVDFRTAYPRWSYRYILVQRFMGGSDTIVADLTATDRRPNPRGLRE